MRRHSFDCAHGPGVPGLERGKREGRERERRGERVLGFRRKDKLVGFHVAMPLFCEEKSNTVVLG